MIQPGDCPLENLVPGLGEQADNENLLLAYLKGGDVLMKT